MTSTSEFRFTVHEDTDRSVVQLVGEFDVYAARRLVPASVDGRRDLVVFDLSCITFLDAGGLQRLLEMRDALHEKGTRVRFRSPSPAVTRLAEILDIDLGPLHGS